MLASLAAAVVLLGFALRLSMRIRRLSRAAAQGMTASGELATRMPGHGAGDELGDLSRSFSRLLVRVRDYNQYLKTMGSKLTHELRTPIAVMRSSLENLEARGAGEDPRLEEGQVPNLDLESLLRDKQIVICCGSGGVGKTTVSAAPGPAALGLCYDKEIVNAIGAATRLEQAIAGAGNERFDLAALVGDLGSAYADAHPGLCIGARIQTGPCEIDGAPELIAQMLDKLVENAVDFTPAGGRILLVLSREDGKALLSVINEGSTLPGDAGDRLFESLVSARPEGDGGAHMGLGLYLARLVAAHHHGGIRATNLPDASGVAFTVALPLADSGKPASRETVS